MCIVRYIINNSNRINIGFVDIDNIETAQRLIYNRLKTDNYESIIIKGVEKTSLNVFLNPERSFLGY